MDERLLVRVIAFMAVVVTVGWFLAFIVLPAVRGPEYQPAPEITALMGTIFTALAGSLGVAYFKARNPTSATRKPRDRADRDDDNDETESGGERDADD